MKSSSAGNPCSFFKESFMHEVLPLPKEKELPFKKDKIIAKVLGQKIEKTFGDKIIYIGE